MKSTGVVRRIDELGRVVIPKEIRRTLRIKEGEQLEIFIEDENITLKKFSSLSNFLDLAKVIVEVVNNVFGKNILITDRDKIIAINSKYREDYYEKRITKYLEKIMLDRKKVVENNFREVQFTINIEERFSYLVYPIIVNSDVVGLVSLFSDKEKIDEEDEKIADLVVKFFSKVVEE